MKKVAFNDETGIMAAAGDPGGAMTEGVARKGEGAGKGPVGFKSR